MTKKFKFTESERDEIALVINDYSLSLNKTIDRIESILSERGEPSPPKTDRKGASEWSAKLYKVASALLTDRLSEYSEDWPFTKSTPSKVVREILYNVKRENDKDRVRAMDIKYAIDAVQSELSAAKERIKELERQINKTTGSNPVKIQ